jgi:RNA polymerase sigma factor (sigma-70 family)
MNYIREAIDYLRNYQDLKIAAENLEDKINELNGSLEGYKEINNSGMPGGGGSSAPDDAICNLIFQRDKSIENLDDTNKAIVKIENALSKLSEEEKKILIKSYSQEMTDTQISDELNISRRTFYRYRSEAIRKLAVQLFGIQVIK